MRFQTEAATGCIKHCFSNLKVPTVSQAESDCMTNCTAKALETYTWMQYFKVTEHPRLM